MISVRTYDGTSHVFEAAYWHVDDKEYLTVFRGCWEKNGITEQPVAVFAAGIWQWAAESKEPLS